MEGDREIGRDVEGDREVGRDVERLQLTVESSCKAILQKFVIRQGGR